jgi:sugar/nucleoside kinase (ribokinase family)
MVDFTGKGSRRARDVVVIGDINPDLVLSSADLTVAFGQRETLVEEATLTLGGSAAICACAMARLGLATSIIGLVGGDAFGRYCRGELEAAGVGCGSVVVSPEVQTAITVVLQRADDRAIITHATAIAALTPAHLDMAALCATRHVHVSSYFLLDGLRADLPALLGDLRAGGCTVSLDTNWDPFETFALDDILPRIDVLLPNAEEARLISGHSDLDRAVRHLAATVPVVAVTDGRRGALVASGDRILRAAAPEVDPARVVDAIGAGDAFDAGFVAGYLETGDIADGLCLGLATAALSVTGRGGTGAQPSRAEAESLAQTIKVSG